MNRPSMDSKDPTVKHTIRLDVNGEQIVRQVEPRLLLSDFLRHDLNLTGSHVGCEHGSCGACTVLMDGDAVRSCIIFAVQAAEHHIETVESLGDAQNLHPLQEAFRDEHALQCGYCTAGFLMLLVSFLRQNPNPIDDEIRVVIASNLCRCTGYNNILKATKNYLQTLKHPDKTPIAIK